VVTVAVDVSFERAVRPAVRFWTPALGCLVVLPLIGNILPMREESSVSVMLEALAAEKAASGAVVGAEAPR
jgi:hypothetical protein